VTEISQISDEQRAEELLEESKNRSEAELRTIKFKKMDSFAV